jgi:hypothetical protein
MKMGVLGGMTTSSLNTLPPSSEWKLNLSVKVRVTLRLIDEAVRGKM